MVVSLYTPELGTTSASVATVVTIAREIAIATFLDTSRPRGLMREVWRGLELEFILSAVDEDSMRNLNLIVG